MTNDQPYCAVASVAGRRMADTLFGMRLPHGFDMDQPGDELAAAKIADESAAQDKLCRYCPARHVCHQIQGGE